MWPSIWMKTIFQKNLQFGDVWPRNRRKIAQIEVFGHFRDFASLAFLDFAHNDRWAWCLVVFLQFVCPFNVFLFAMKICVGFTTIRNYFSRQLFFIVHRFVIKSFLHIIANFVPRLCCIFQQMIIFDEKQRVFTFFETIYISTHFWEAGYTRF